ncbi:PRC-barrel domain-containing protein [Frigidibacter sp. SD6-1]|uniref:PRC-barrel domain-containing protein n=1 Tax=Frigidibacter sp. SD6-1 TaxID=3032581 RepID=UPI0024DFACD7|nr:PRC-barrel domain-containing protein [Frigidibacter sp. SD6-1]
MKNLLLSTAVLAAVGTAAFAEDKTAMFRMEADPMEIHASDFIGKRIYASEAEIEGKSYERAQPDWEDIGEINDVVLSRNGKVEAVLVDVGGFLGIGERQIAIDMAAVRFLADDATPEDLSDYFLVITAPRAAVEGAPEYTWTHNAAAKVDQAVENSVDAATSTAEAAGDQVEQAAENTADAAREPIVREGYAPAKPEDLTTEMLTGTKVYDANDEWIGDVSQLLITTDGKITDAIVDVGGFLGIGEKPVQLKIGDIDILRKDDGSDLRVYVGMTKEQLEALPTYDK